MADAVDTSTDNTGNTDVTNTDNVDTTNTDLKAADDGGKDKPNSGDDKLPDDPGGDEDNKSKKDGDDDKTDDDGGQIAPESYETFTLPEGIEMDAALLDTVSPMFKEMNLTQENSQKLVDAYAQQKVADAQAQAEAFNQLVTGWDESVKKDSTLSGDKFEENLAVAKLAVAKFGSPELLDALDESGMGSHPKMVEFMFAVGAILKEDVPDADGNASKGEQDFASRMYK